MHAINAKPCKYTDCNCRRVFYQSIGNQLRAEADLLLAALTLTLLTWPIFLLTKPTMRVASPRGCKLFSICKMPMKLVERGCGKSFTLWNWFLRLGILLTSNYMGIWANINLNLLIRIFSITNQNLKKGFWHFHLFQISGGTIMFCNQLSRTCWYCHICHLWLIYVFCQPKHFF